MLCGRLAGPSHSKNNVTIAAFAALSNKISIKEKIQEYTVWRFKNQLISWIQQKDFNFKGNFQYSFKNIWFKEYQPWKYENDKGIKCHLHAETMNHFATCSSYLNKACEDWATINGLDREKNYQSWPCYRRKIQGKEKRIWVNRGWSAPHHWLHNSRKLLSIVTVMMGFVSLTNWNKDRYMG